MVNYAKIMSKASLKTLPSITASPQSSPQSFVIRASKIVFQTFPPTAVAA